MWALLLNEPEEVLALFFLQGSCILHNDKLKLYNRLQFSHVCFTQIIFCLVHELEAIFPAVKIDFIDLGPLFDSFAQISTLILDTLVFLLYIGKFFHLRPG